MRINRKKIWILIFLVIILFFISACQYKDGTFMLDSSADYNSDGRILTENQPKSSNLILEIKAEDDFELFDVNFKLSKVYPTEISDFVIDRVVPVKLQLHPSIQKEVSFSKTLILRGDKKYAFQLPEDKYYASIENGRLIRGFRFNPIESEVVLFMFGYSFDTNYNGGYIERVKNPFCYEVPNAETFGKYRFACPIVTIEEGKTTQIIIKIGKRKWNSFWKIFFHKFIPGIIWLGPVSNGSYYFHRDYEIEVIGPN